jgi:putative endopeptidase
MPTLTENLNISRMKTLRRSTVWRAAALSIGLALATAADAASESASPFTHGLDLAGIDHSVQPGVDFFAYANGTWLKETAIPPDRSSYGIGAMLVEITDKRTVGLIQEAGAQSGAKDSEARQIGDYYASFMDELAIEKQELRPLEPTLARISAITDRKALAQALGATLRADVDALNSTNFYTDNLFGLWVAQDLNNPSRYAAYLLQGGLGMPDHRSHPDACAYSRRECQSGAYF